jgi:uncharacterized glyoxalase superfamily protein PhnB
LSNVVFRSVVPILAVRDVAGSAAFYQSALGFAVDFLYGTPAFYGSVSRGPVCLHLRCVKDRDFAPRATSDVSPVAATIEVSDVLALFAEFGKSGAPLTDAPARQAWGGTDFQVRDPDGNVISFVTYG